ncbi:MAG TPA: DinB family protein [Terriglobales bacterium]|nr:DinB family protein [Terriglobales bacterium]
MSKSNPQDTALRQQLDELLGGGGAHARFDDLVKGIPPELRGQKPDGLPHSAWMILEHLRIAQWDILEFSRNQRHQSPEWPGGYWPKNEAPPSLDAWDRSVEAFRGDLDAMRKLVKNPATDLYAKIPWGEGQTILREALLVADHNAYHLGQLLDVRRLLGIWKDE